MASYNDPNYGNQGAYWGDQQDSQESYNFDMSAADFGQDLQFQSFSGSNQSYPPAPLYSSNPYLDPSQGYQGEIFTPSASQSTPGASDNFEEEPPLLEELGINPDHILQKTLAVLNPFRELESEVLQDADLAGPLVFCLAFGAFLLLSGKVHFNYIYGIGVLGCVAMYALLGLMSASGTSLTIVISVLGYCLLPMVVLSGIHILLSLQGIVGIILTVMSILWCSLSASKLFAIALNLDSQQPLVAYPCALLYGVFALITIF